MESKVCTKCDIEQDVENFYIRRTRNNQRKSICKGCESIQKAKPIEVVPDLDGEIWRDIKGYEGIYLVSNMGRVKRILHRKNPTNTIMNRSVNDFGYFYHCLTINGKGKNFMVSRLVATAFIPNPENKPQVNHLKEKDRNEVENLEWNTSKENINHAWETGLSKPANGTLNGNSILTEKEVLEIRKSGFHRHRLSTIYKVSVYTIDHILNRTRWKHI
jgi:hypothetical protein